MFKQSVLESIEVINHSGIRINSSKVIYIDPISVSGTPHDADLILFTHPHRDHFSPKDVKKLLKADTVIAAPKSMSTRCRIFLGKEPVSLMPAQSLNLCDIPVETVAAYNIKKPNHMKAKNWLGYILDIDGTRVYIAGDTDITEESRRVSCDIALLPVGGSFTMDPKQAAELANFISPHTVIPIHYGKLIGGAEAAENFRSAVDPHIETDIRPSACSDVLLKMYAKIGAMAVAFGILIFIMEKMFF